MGKSYIYLVGGEYSSPSTSRNEKLGGFIIIDDEPILTGQVGDCRIENGAIVGTTGHPYISFCIKSFFVFSKDFFYGNFTETPRSEVVFEVGGSGGNFELATDKDIVLEGKGNWDRLLLHHVKCYHEDLTLPTFPGQIYFDNPYSETDVSERLVLAPLLSLPFRSVPFGSSFIDLKMTAVQQIELNSQSDIITPPGGLRIVT